MMTIDTSAKHFLDRLRSLKGEDRTEKLRKELTTTHFGSKAVLVETSEIDLDTDGGHDEAIAWDKTHQDETTLKWPHGSNVNSNATRFVVIPIGWGARHGMSVGDIGLAQIDSCPQVFGVIIADLGPPTKIGEGSLALFRAFGAERVKGNRIVDAGMDGTFRMLLFPGSGDGRCHDNAVTEERAWMLWEGLMK